MTGNGSAIASKSEHHAFLHGPCVIATDESDKAVIAIVATSEVSSVDGFTFDEERIELGQYHARLAIRDEVRGSLAVGVRPQGLARVW